MKIKWYGQSCFRIVTKDGTRIVMDPYNNMLGYKLPCLDADIVTTSHEHRDHNNVGAIGGEFEHIKEAGRFSTAGIEIKGVETFHDKVSGAKKGKNIVYCFKIDDLNVCHLGDLGHLLETRQIQEIGRVDVLLLPVGGTYTVDAADAAEVMKQLKPKIIIPMHYRTKALGVPGMIFGTVEGFIKVSKIKARKEKELDVSLQDIDTKAGIVILDYK